MSAQVLYLENALTPQNRIVHDVEPCSIQSLAPKWNIPFVALLDGEVILRAEWDAMLNSGQSLLFIDVNAIPQSGGGGGSNPLQIVLMVAVMYFTVGAGAGAWAAGTDFATVSATGAFTGLTFAGTLVGTGMMMAGMALISALIPPPQPTSPQTAAALAAASPTYNIQAQGNTARLEAAIPEHFGRLKAFPDFAAQPYQEFSGNDQYLYQLLCIGRGYYTLADAERVNDRVSADLARAGVRFAKTYIAPEAPDQPSRVRKPSPQFLFDARDEFALNLAESYMVGDKLIDLECGWNAGVKQSILVRTGYGAGVEREDAERIKPAAVVDGLAEMAEWILQSLKR